MSASLVPDHGRSIESNAVRMEALEMASRPSLGRLRSNMTNIAMLTGTAQRAMEIAESLWRGATRPKLAKTIISQNTKVR
jgi:hypothetical protein